jgi:hypothetical protein
LLSESCYLPDIVLSIIGETKYQNIDFVTKNLFKKNLNKSRRLDTWIITGGFNCGIGELIDEAIDEDLKSNYLPVFGITSLNRLSFNLDSPNEVCIYLPP